MFFLGEAGTWRGRKKEKKVREVYISRDFRTQERKKMGKGPDQAKYWAFKKKKVAGQARELRALEIKMEFWDRRDRRWSVG